MHTGPEHSYIRQTDLLGNNNELKSLGLSGEPVLKKSPLHHKLDHPYNPLSV